jgi:2-polyprenyl-3-methyl-5-hydroxy-6-metoxy-1,4-benzoquinol methylase
VSQVSSGSHCGVGVKASLLNYLHACPICDGNSLKHYCRVRSLFTEGEFIQYDRCKACQTVLRNPRLPDDYRIQIYEEKVLSHDQKGLDPVSQTHYYHMLQTLKALVPDNALRRLLDFGCGAGGFLVEARDAGFDVVGLEVNKDLASAVADQYGIRVFQGLITDAAFENETFNFIISSQVFEHLLDPKTTLQSLISHLEPGGVILIEVPNLSHIRERFKKGSTMDDSHLFYFNRYSLSKLLTSTGFQIIAIQEGLRPFQFFNGYGKKLPSVFVKTWERFFSMCQIKTGLSVIARF